MAKLIDLIVSGKSSFANDVNAKDIYADKFIKNGSSSSYVLLGDGSHKKWNSAYEANTIVARDANGYIFATYYNSNISNEDTITIGSVYVRNTSDNWIRRMSFTKFVDNLYSNGLDGRYVNVSGDTMTGLLTVKTGSSNNGIKAGNTYINSIEGSLIFQNNTALRFGGADWDWNVWAGLKYVHSSKTIYLGLADNNAFTANSAQSGGKIYFPGIDNLYIGHGTYKLWHEGNDGSGSGLDADLLDGLHSSSYAIWRGVVNTDPTAADVTSTDTSDFLTRLHNTSNLFGTNFSAFRGSWWYAGNTQVNTGVGTLEMAGTAVLNMSHGTGASINYKSLLFLTAYGELYSFASEESGVATWSRYSKHGHTHDDRYYTESEADGRFVNVTGDTMSGSLTLKGSTSDNMTSSGNVHPFISFDNSDSSQIVRILFTDYDSYRSPAGLKIVGNQGNEWLEVAGVTYGPGFCHTSYASATYLLRSDGGAAAFNWSGQGGQPTWLWGGNTQHAYYVYNPSNFSVAYSAQSPAAANWGGTGSTTKIKIKINSTTSWMLCFVVTLYQGYSATKVMISGYNYGSNYWYEPEAVLLGNSNAATSISVYFGYDSAWNLWVGFDGGSYTGVSVSDVTNGYTQITSLKDLFTISNVSSLTTLQTTVTATNTVMYSDNTTNVYVNQHTGNDVEYPLVWSNQNNTGSHRSNQLYKSYSNLTYNPSNKGVTAGQFKANNSAGPHFTGTSSTGSWAYLRLNNSSNVWDIATNTASGSGGLWLSRYGGLDNGIFVSASSTPKVGINTSSPSYALHVINDAYATGWARAGSGFYVEGKGVHYMSNNASGLGQIYLTSNEFNWSASTTTLYFNYRASANGTTVTSYVWNAGSSSTYANHTTGKIDAKSHVLTTDNFGINSTAGSGRGISLYGGSDYVGTYGIAFNQTSNWGTHGYVTGDWATYFTMSNTENRGWIFRAGSNRFSIDGDGHAYANGLVNANYFNSRVATGTQPYACTSTTLNTNLNADLLDGNHGSRYTSALGSSNYVTVTVGGDAATYYPVVISSVSDYYPMQLVNISRHYSETAPNSWHSSTHKGGLTCTLLWNGSRYWDGNSSGAACYCVYVNQTYSTMLGGFGNSTHGKVVWLRGGGAAYHIHAMNGTSVSATVYTSTFTDSASQSFAPTTSVRSYSVRWPGYAEGADYATSAGNADTVDGQHFSYSNSSNSPTYLWGTNSNGSSFLAARGSISVNYANYAGYTTKLRRRDDSSDYSLQHHWTGTYWYLRGYSGDSYHAGVQVEYANNAGNADTVDGLHAHTQNLNNQANKLVRTEGNGYIQTSYIYYGGNEKNNANPTYVAGFNGSDNYIRSYNTAYLRVSNADMVDDIHANRFAFIYNSANYNASSSLTLTDIAANANSNAHMGMIYAGTDNPVSTSGNWLHVWSQSWTRGSTASWCSQIALGVQQGTGMWYRTTSGALAGRGWYRVIDSGNIGSQSVNYANSAGAASSVTINYNNNSNSTYQMLWGSGNYVYGTSGIYCNPYSDILYAEHHHGISHASSWLDGQRYANAAFLVSDATDTGSYWPWMRQTNTGSGKWYSMGVLSNSLYFIGSTTSRTANSYDYGFRMDFSNGYFYGNTSGYHSGTSTYASYIDSTSFSAGSATNPVYFTGGRPSGCTYSLNATVNGGTTGNLAYYSGTNTISTYNTSLGSRGNPVYLSAGKLVLANTGIIWSGYVYRSGYSYTTWYTSYSFDSTLTLPSGETTWVVASASTNSSTGLMTITLSTYGGKASVTAYSAFAFTRSIYNGSTYYPQTGSITGRSAGMGDYWIYCSGSTIYIKKLKQQNGNNDKWADTDLITTTTSDGNKPVLSFNLIIFGSIT